ncbi:MAG: LuxR family transcriptional regulator [Bacteroidia bacterium]|nr:LuxR family transcriptional regulator [Bacteroidia bacterium]
MNADNIQICKSVFHNFFPKEIISQFDSILNIEDDPITLLKKILFADIEEDNKTTQENISEREMDVLLLLVNGLSNKEIADKLNISPHTVISHRKSITQKTGIKSQSGLTIYAITNKLISIES